MAFLLQDRNGLVQGANAYITVAYFTEYHSDRGTDVNTFVSPTGDANTEMEAAIIRATDYLDTRFYYIGNKFNYSQSTEFPRSFFNSYYNTIQLPSDNIPREVKEATAEYALVAMQGEINPTPYQSISDQKVVERKEKIGDLEEVVKYESGVSGYYTHGANTPKPIYPKGDQKLIKSGLVMSGTTLVRT